MPGQVEKCRRFRALHEGPGTFVMPNPWDVGSTLYLQSLGFEALATTSAGAAFSLGKPDGGVPVESMLAHVWSLAEATTLPLNADFLDGFSADTATMAQNVRLCVETGVAGLSIEDATGDPARPLYPAADAVERVRAARAAIDATGIPVVLTARAEAFLVGADEPLRTVLDRLAAFAAAGADCLYAPGLRRPEDIAAVVQAVAPKPVNVLALGPGFSVRHLEDLGVRRISIGAGLARAAWGGFARAAREIVTSGTFESFADALPSRELNDLFQTRGA